MNVREETDSLEPVKFINEFQVADHQFQVLTELKEKQVESSVSEQGRVVYQKWFPLNSNLIAENDAHWSQKAREAHEQVMEEIESLFNIKERIASVTQGIYRYRFGRVLLSFNFVEEAKEEFLQAIELKPDFIKARRKLAACYLKEKQYTQAVQILLEAMDLSPSFPDLLNDLGVAYTFTHQYDQARDCFIQALKQKEDFQEANFNLGILLLLSSYENETEQKVVVPVRVIRSLNVLKNVPYLDGTLWKERVEWVLEKIHEGKTEGLLKDLIDLQIQLITRDDPVAVKFDLFFLKFMYGKTKMDDEAMAFYENWLTENIQKFKYADYWNDMGIIHLIQCRNYFLNALEEIEKAHQLNPHFTEAAENLEKIRRIKNGFLILLRALLKK